MEPQAARSIGLRPAGCWVASVLRTPEVLARPGIA